MDNDTADSLTSKLSGLDLTDDEATMLTMLIGGSIEDADDEVVGFAQPKYDEINIGVGELQECTISKHHPVRQQIGAKIAPTIHSWSWGESNS